MAWVVPQFVPLLGEEEARAVADCVRSGWITEGPLCTQLVEEIKRIIGVKYGVLAPNGTLALYLALRACGVGHGWEVIVPDLTFIASATAVVMAGARPVFVDVNRNAQMDLRAARAASAAEQHTAWMPVHLYGFACNEYAADKTGWPMVIEDACQGLGVEFAGRPCGSFGDASAFSFFADKVVTTGEGGFVGTNNELVYDRLRYLRNQGRKDRGSFVHPEIGQNFRLTDVQAAIGLSQLRRFPELVARRRAIHARYTEKLNGVIDVLQPPSGSTHIPFRTVVLFPDAAAAAKHLSEKGIEPRTVFYPLHRQPCFQYLNRDQRHGDDKFPQANELYLRGLCLPTFPGMTDQQVDLVCEASKDFMRSGR
jgi:perosamine synthetase